MIVMTDDVLIFQKVSCQLHTRSNQLSNIFCDKNFRNSSTHITAALTLFVILWQS